MVNIVILGKGFVGNHLYNFLKTKNDLHVDHISRAQVDYFSEISLKKFLREMFHFPHNDIVLINCSGYTGSPNVDACEINKETCFEYNTVLPVFLSNFCAEYKHYLINISSGCIYTGYDKEFTEEDTPNFGLYNNDSSFYSKTKHIAELLYDRSHTSTFRIRMPFCSYMHPKNILTKIINYNNLISYKNSLTSLDELSLAIYTFLKNSFFRNAPGIYNAVNPGGIDAEEIVQILSKHNIINKNWKFVKFEELNTKANRSNCVLSPCKLEELDIHFCDSRKAVEESIISIANEKYN